MRHHLKNWCECSFHSIPIDRAWDASLCECTCHSIPIDRACDTSLFWVPFKLHPWLNITTACPVNCGLGLQANYCTGLQDGEKLYLPNLTLALIHLRILRLVRVRAMLRENSTTRSSMLDGSISSRLCTTGSMHLKGTAGKTSMLQHARIISIKACVWVDFEGWPCLTCMHYKP